MKIRFEVIEMPEVNEVRAVSNLRREWLAQEQQAEIDSRRVRANDDLPRFIRFINSKIDEAKMDGRSVVCFNYNSEHWAIKDPRCEFTFKGTPDYTHAKFIENLYKELGFSGYVHNICCTTNRAYRDGEVYLHW